MWQKQAVAIIDDILRTKPPLSVTCILGAGAGVASGLKTFRGLDGLYKGKQPEELASRRGFEQDPHLVWGWYRMRMDNVLNAEPNAIHQSLVKLEQFGVLQKVITQNVDGLSRLAGQSASKLIEIHGTILKSHCFSECGLEKSWLVPPTDIPVMCECGSYQRPSVVWFGEGLNVGSFHEIEEVLQNTNLLLIIGTSGYVYPVASFPEYAKRFGAKLIEFNVEKTPFAAIDDLFVEGPAEERIGDLTKIIDDLLN